ncbi:MAG: hypothetical protein JWN46_1129 [Acidimicrobiales bacterium]|nr:hypothetical protein [Acidimicrobiales bacterium]
MGFLDKVKSQVEQVAKQGQEKLDDLQAKKKAEGLLRDLGAWYYAVQTGRDEGKGTAELDRIVADLRAHEAEHGPLGARDDDAAPAANAPTPPPVMAAPPTTPPPPPTDAVPPPPPGVIHGTPEVHEPGPDDPSVDEV